MRTFSESGIFPDRLKTAKVKKLYKGKAIHDVQKYKPVSFLLHLKKTQKLMCNRSVSPVIKKLHINRGPK